MTCTVHADGFPPYTTERELRDLFAQFGPVHSVQIAKTAEGKSIGVAEIEMAESSDAVKAVEALHHTYLHGKLLLVFVRPVRKQ